MKIREYDIELLKEKFREIPLSEAIKLYHEGTIYRKSLKIYGITEKDLFQDYFPGDKIIVEGIPCYVIDTYLGTDKPRWVVADITLCSGESWSASMEKASKDNYISAPISISNLFGKKKILISKDWRVPSKEDFNEFGPTLSTLCCDSFASTTKSSSFFET